MDSLTERAAYLLQYAREMRYKIIFVNHYEKEGTFSPENECSNIIEELHPQAEDTIISKYKISSFYQTELEQELKDIENIVVAGIPTNLCVRMFVEEAYDRGFNLVLIEDICQTYNEKLQDFTFDDLNESRPDLDIVRLDQFFV
jgi:nicotinamidase-related amidase